MAVHIGVTGTRQALDERQLRWLKDELVMLDLSVRLVRLQKPILHHGDCKGADATAHEMAQALGWSICIHPPIKEQFRAFCKDAEVIAPPAGYFARDRDIVRACSIILAVPGTPLRLAGLAGIVTDEDLDRGKGEVVWDVVKKAGGTWYTTMQALARGREVKICSP